MYHFLHNVLILRNCYQILIEHTVLVLQTLTQFGWMVNYQK